MDYVEVSAIDHEGLCDGNEFTIDAWFYVSGAFDDTHRHVIDVYESDEALEEIFEVFGPYVRATIRHRVKNGQNCLLYTSDAADE